MKIHNHPQGSDEWFAARLGKLTASKAQTIQANGKGLETLVYQLVAEKLSGAREDTYTNPDMERGNELEDTARSSYEMETGNEVIQVGFCEQNEHVGASPDGFVGEDGLVEIKCPKNSNYIKTKYTQKIDKAYEWQMQMQMFVTDRKWCDYVVFNENFPDLIIIRVERDNDMAEKLVKGINKGIDLIGEICRKLER